MVVSDGLWICHHGGFGRKALEAGGMMGEGGMGQRSRESLVISESTILDGSYNTCRRTCLEREL